jgi:putative peptide zinc metalloprotease protein
MREIQKVEPPLSGSRSPGAGPTTELTDPTVPVRPLLAEDVQLIGEFDGPGLRDRQWLLMKDGRFVQLTELLYRVLEQADGVRDLDEMASNVGQAIERVVSRENVEHLVRTTLLPMGLIVGTDGVAASDAPKTDFLRSPMQINLKVKIAGRRIEPIARVLTFLHTRPAMISVLGAVALVHGWLFGIHGVIGPLRYLVANPDVMLIVLPVMLAASVFHEFGHASALMYEGGRVRWMGGGFVLVFPALYTDVTDGYRLSRRARVRIDLAGPYFHLIFGLVTASLYLLTGEIYWLILILLIDVEVGRQFLPIGRLDGYWAMADLSGIPDFFSRLVPFVASLLPVPVPREMRLPELTPRARRIFVAYILALVIGFPAFLVYILSHLPVLLAAGWEAFMSETDLFRTSFRTRDIPTALASGLQVLFLVLGAVGASLFLYLITWRPAGKVWMWSRTRPGFLRRTARGSLFVIGGAMAALFGSLYPWRIFEVTGLGPARPFNGIDTVAGRAVLVGSVCALLAGGAMIVSWHLPLRRIAAAVALALGVAGSILFAVELVNASGLTDGWIRATIEGSTGREPTSSEFAAVRRQMSALGLAVGLGYGVWVTGIGSLLAMAGGALAISSRAPSPDSLEPLEADLPASPPTTAPRRRPGLRALVAGVAIVAVGLAGAFVSYGVPTRRPLTPPPPPESEMESNLDLWSPVPSDLRDRVVTLGLPLLSEEALAFHTHQHLDVFLHGVQIRVPAGIGIDPAGEFLTVLHTHGSDGVIHVESPARRGFTLGQFFDVWGVRLTARCLGEGCGDGHGERVRVFVNGKLMPGDPDEIPLRDRDEILVAFGARDELPDPVPSTYRFESGS